MKLDLTPAEQTNVRTALRFLRNRCNGWKPLAAALGFGTSTMMHIGGGRKVVSAKLAFRVAKFASVSVDALLKGEFPAPGTCPHCGNRTASATEATASGSQEDTHGRT